jgi:hypothetical protein
LFWFAERPVSVGMTRAVLGWSREPMLVGGGEYNNTGSRSLRFFSCRSWCRRPVFVVLGGAYDHRPPAQWLSFGHAPRGVAAGEDSSSFT